MALLSAPRCGIVPALGTEAGQHPQQVVLTRSRTPADRRSRRGGCRAIRRPTATKSRNACQVRDPHVGGVAIAAGGMAFIFGFFAWIFTCRS